MPFADRDTPGIRKVDALIHIVRDDVLFKAIVVSDLDDDARKAIEGPLEKWCTDPDQTVLQVSSNVEIAWQSI